ncbi:right-handed parallel beta-helix repeat-containing protein [Candidatus Sumerlaeota bacterium]|nr:right-handed parallel beta-helix repeat-containing protein [Candidatus Sumerlaeota bacterium]
MAWTTSNSRRSLSPFPWAVIALTLCLLIWPLGKAWCATVIDVGGTGPHATVQAGVDAAASGDTVRVAAGTYSETVEIDVGIALEGGWNADFSARDWDTNVTTIDAVLAGSVVWVNTPDPVTIEGFTITNGRGDAGGGDARGGGILVDNGTTLDGSVAILHCVVTGNIAQEGDGHSRAQGGGIAVHSGDVLIEHSEISGNVAQSGGTEYGQGGGIYLDLSVTAEVVSNTITGNLAANGLSASRGDGGGIFTDGDNNSEFRDNEIAHNTASVNRIGYGGGFFGAGELCENHIHDNRASVIDEGDGGGVYLDYVEDFHDNLVEDNWASDSGDGTGGGVYGYYMVDAYRNIIRSNHAARGGGIYLGSSAQGELRGNLIALNEATGMDAVTGDGGGGILMDDGGEVLLENQILMNTAALTGGGIRVLGDEHYEIRRNVISGNQAAAGGGIHVSREPGTLHGPQSITQNQITGNTATVWGGGLMLAGVASPVLDSNTVTGNSAAGMGDTAGAGILLGPETGTTVRLTNHIVASNTTGADLTGGIQCLGGICEIVHCTVVDNDGVGVRFTDGGGVHRLLSSIIVGHETGVVADLGSIVEIDHNDAWDNVTDIEGDAWGAHHQSVNPQFTDRLGGNYHLSETSTLADGGDPAILLTIDADQEPRPRGTGLDIGADEIYRAVSHVSAGSGSDITGDGSAEHPFSTVDLGLRETTRGGQVLVAEGTYVENLVIERSVDLLGGHNDGDWDRDVDAHPTVLDGSGALDSTVAIQGNGTSALIEGFTITGGEAEYPSHSHGGGIVVGDEASALIRQNTVTGNHAVGGGGGIAVLSRGWSIALISSNHVHGNTASAEGEGAAPGGGILVRGGSTVVANNVIHHNSATLGGDGLGLGYQGGELEQVLVWHNTLVDNGGASGEGVRFEESRGGVELRNNLIVGHATGIAADAVSAANWDHSLFYEVAADYSPGLTPGANDVHGDPLFFSRAGEDYHVIPGSAAIDTAVDIGVPVDFEGQVRPQRSGVDIGADECRAMGHLDVVDYLLGLTEFVGIDHWLADDNSDTVVNTADVVHLVNRGL